MKYFGSRREGCDNGLVIQRPFGVCVSFEFYLKGEVGRRKRDAVEVPLQVGGAQVTLIARFRSLLMKDKGKHRLGALDAFFNISYIF
jgi:hypothetical protein